jgi:hypothetical protein
VIDDELFVGSLTSGTLVPDFDPDHEGHGGWRAEEIVNGRIGSTAGKLDEWLIAEEPNIILLHIGTNDIGQNNEDWNEVEDIMVVIDDYESASGKAVWVVIALIIDRSCDPYLPPCPKSLQTTNFNNDVREFVFIPRQAGGDKIVLVDMQNDAGIDYNRWDMGGDMWDNLHPYETGNSKMGELWFSALMEILPQADAGSDQSVETFETVTLDCSGSTDPKIGNGNNLSYNWVQTAGTPVVPLSDNTAVQPTFDAPGVGVNGEVLTFMLTVTDEDELVSTDTVEIKVIPFAEIIGTWNSGIWYRDVAAPSWTQMTSSVTDGDIAAGDFTGDGIADVASIWSSGLWYQDGATLDWIKIPGTAPNRVTAGDVTGDGRFEIIGTWSSGIWYWDVAESRWTKMTSSVTDGDIAAGDFTGDGKADVASIYSSGLWYQDGATLDWTKVTSSAPDRVTAGDVTGDGRFEIIGTWDSGIWYWDVTASKWTIMYPTPPDGDIAAGDFTGDGKADVASSWDSGLWYQDGATLGWTKVSSSAVDRLTAGDVN